MRSFGGRHLKASSNRKKHMFKHKQILFGLDHEQMNLNHLAHAIDHEHVGHLTDDRLNLS